MTFGNSAFSEIERLLVGQVATCQFCRKSTIGRWVIVQAELAIGPRPNRNSSGRRCQGSDFPALIEPIAKARF